MTFSTATYPNDSIASPYLQTVYLYPRASWGSGVSWSNNNGEAGVGGYEREYAYDKAGNRAQMHLYAANGSTIENVTWTMEYNGESPSPPALSHQREREPVEEYATNQWCTLETATHKPGALGSLVHKRVYTYSSGTSGTPSGQNDYTYTYDAVGNVVAVYNANSTNRGNELYFFSQDAFGNELSTDTGASLFGGSEWDVARSNGITEHQTGKSNDPFTGLYFFAARWYDSGVGRFVGRDRHSTSGVLGCASNQGSPHVPLNARISMSLGEGGRVNAYVLSINSPLTYVDPTGDWSVQIDLCAGISYICGGCIHFEIGCNPGGGVLLDNDVIWWWLWRRGIL